MIGALGVVWVFAWLILIRPRDLTIKEQDDATISQDDREAAAVDRATVMRRFVGADHRGDLHQHLLAVLPRLDADDA